MVSKGWPRADELQNSEQNGCGQGNMQAGKLGENF